MRTKDEILKGAKDMIINPHDVAKVPFWLEYRKLEVLIDIRDILDNRLLEIDRGLHALSKKD